MSQRSKNPGRHAPLLRPGGAPWLTAAVAVVTVASLLAPVPEASASPDVAAARSVAFSSTGEVDQSFLQPADGPWLPRIRLIGVGSTPGRTLGWNDAVFEGRR